MQHYVCILILSTGKVSETSDATIIVLANIYCDRKFCDNRYMQKYVTY